MAKMKKSEAIDLDGSDDVLKHTNGETNLEVLQRILYDATEREVKPDSLVITTHEKRARNFKPDDPSYRTVTHTVKLRGLFSLYRRETGEKYKQPTPQEVEEKWQHYARTRMSGW
jgi:hypothetical protein